MAFALIHIIVALISFHRHFVAFEHVNSAAVEYLVLARKY